MHIFYYFLILFAFAFFEFIASFTFTFKIHKIAKEEFTKAAFLGMIATIVSSIAIPTIAFVGLLVMNGNGIFGLTGFWAGAVIVIIGAALASVGNYISTILIPHITNHYQKDNLKNDIYKKYNLK